ncbi:MAG: PQQ-binding-like beta-propeller repeat protein [Lacipirellulaceae bacterium]
MPPRLRFGLLNRTFSKSLQIESLNEAMHIRRTSFYIALFFLFSPQLLLAKSDLWPQWRGPQRDGQAVEEDAAWPEKLDEGMLVEKWRKPFGPSYSGPIVTADRVFTTETRGEKQEYVFALNRKTGDQLWEQHWDGAMKVPFFAASNGSWIRATPAYDAQSDRLYVAGIQDVLVCVDAKTGEKVWSVDFKEKYGTPNPAFGFASSPLVDGDAVYVQAAESFIKVDKNSGDILWRTAVEEGRMNSAFSSPTIATVAGVRQLLVQMRNDLKGISIDDGKELWSQPIQAFRGMNILTPLVVGESTLFTSAHSGRSQLWQIKPSGDGAFAATEVWQAKAKAYMSSPVIVGDFLYMHLQNQRFTCLDLKTGEEKWRTKPFGKYWSMVAQGDKILALDETGDLRLIRANPEKYDLLDERHITDASSWAHVAVVGGEVFVRTLDELIAYRWE